jgi:entericidin B
VADLWCPFLRAGVLAVSGPNLEEEHSMKNTMAKGLAAALLIATALPVLAACNTMAGVGEDVQRGGAAIERQADRAR